MLNLSVVETNMLFAFLCSLVNAVSSLAVELAFSPLTVRSKVGAVIRLAASY
jgi:hypothetical protein